MSDPGVNAQGASDLAAADAAARDGARDVARSIHLQAPAGSGKTTVLSQRFLAALAVVDEPEEVLAITFTRKAAAEMKERVLAALDAAPSGAGTEQARWESLRAAVQAQAVRREWKLQELPQRLRIQTIDSLAAELARAMPVLGRMQSSLRVVDDAGLLYAEAARRTLAEGDSDASSHADIDSVLRRLDNNSDQARRLLAALLPSRNRWLQLILEHGAHGLAAVVQDSLARITSELLQRLQSDLGSAWLDEGASIARASARHVADRLLAAGQPVEANPWLQDTASLAADPLQLHCWQAVSELLLLKGEEGLRKLVTATHGFPPKSALKQRWQDWRDALASRPNTVALLCELRALPAPVLDEQEHRIIAALARVLLLCAAQLTLLFRERGTVDHSEVAAIARQALASLEEGGFALHQALRVTHLLVDESQDTSPDQIDLVRALTAGWQRGDRRSLFLVGDPMQSIYLFRGSEVGLFLRTRSRGIGPIALEALQLTRNFRSQRELVQWANEAFLQVFPLREDLRTSAVPFLAAHPARSVDERLPAAVTVWPQARDDADDEARAIASEILVLRARDPQLSVAVLVQKRSVAAPILRALQAAGIPTAGVDLAALADRAVVRDLVALGQALLDAGDRTAWLAVLRSPCVGLTLADLHRLVTLAPEQPLLTCLGDAANMAQLSADGAQRLQRAAPLLLAAWQARGSLDVAGNLERCWQSLGGEAACVDAVELATARQYLLALRRLQEVEGRPDPQRLHELASSLKDREEPSGAAPVEVLTIHRAKGLEWDVVFVPGLGRRAANESSPLLRWLQLPHESGVDDLLMAVRSIGAAQARGGDVLAKYIDRLQAGRLHHERQRLLYVAVTRARLRLYLSGFAARERDTGRPRPAARSLLQLLWPALAPQFDAAAAAAAAAPADEPLPSEPAPLRMLWHRLPADYLPPVAPPLVTPHSLQQREMQAGELVEFSWVGPLARAAGTVMHGELERLARLGETATTDLPARVQVCAAQLREQGIAASTALAAAEELIRRLIAMVREPTARWVLFDAHREAVSELALSGLVEGELRSVVVDRLLVDAQGARWIVDFKTGVHGGGGLEEFVASELERYTPQLRLYARLAARLGPEPVRAALYFPWLGVLRELPASALS